MNKAKNRKDSKGRKIIERRNVITIDVNNVIYVIGIFVVNEECSRY